VVPLQWTRGKLRPHIATNTLPHSRRVGGGCLAIPPLGSFARIFGGHCPGIARPWPAPQQIAREAPRAGYHHLTAPRQDFSRVFEKNLVDPVCVIRPSLTDDFANGISRWLFFANRMRWWLFLRTAMRRVTIFGPSRDVSARPCAGRAVQAFRRLCHGNERRLGRGQGPARAHAAATAFCHCVAASALKIRSVDREIRWRSRLKLL
jgi:hypothetical protein